MGSNATADPRRSVRRSTSINAEARSYLPSLRAPGSPQRPPPRCRVVSVVAASKRLDGSLADPHQECSGRPMATQEACFYRFRIPPSPLTFC